MSLTSTGARADLRRLMDDHAQGCSLVVAEQLLAVATLLASDKALRTTLADAGTSVEARAALVHDLLDGRVDALAVDLVAASARLRWSDADGLVEAIDELGAVVAFTAAEADGSLDAVEEELFRFGRAVDANPDLQMTLTNPALPAAAKAQIVRDLVAAQATATTTALLTHAAATLRGRRVDAVVTALTNLAAAQRERVVAQVRVAVALDDEQQRRLAAALSRLQGREVRLNVVVDPTVVGGASVRIGDDVIDGTMETRLTQARRTLIG